MRKNKFLIILLGIIEIIIGSIGTIYIIVLSYGLVVAFIDYGGSAIQNALVTIPIIILLFPLPLLFLQSIQIIKNKTYRHWYLNFLLLAISLFMLIVITIFLWENTKSYREDWQNIKKFTMSIKKNSYDADSYYKRGLIYYKNRQLTQALDDFNKAIEINPSLDLAYTKRAEINFSNEHYNEAIKDYSEAIKLTPDDVNGYYSRANVYTKIGTYYADVGYIGEPQDAKRNLYNAIADYSMIIKINPNDVKAYCEIGHIYESLDELDLAIENFTEAIRIDPSYSEAYAFRSMLYFRLEKYDKALADDEKGKELGFSLFDSQMEKEAKDALETKK